MSYSQIQAEVKVSKSTLSLWLRDLPLSKERILKLGAWSQRRIESCRNTKARKKQDRLGAVYKSASADIGKLTNREIFLGGLFLYWGEGTKSKDCAVEITNTDPAMIRFGLLWFEMLGIPTEGLAIDLKIYKDMDIESAVLFWEKEIKVDQSQFNVYIKKTNQSDITYKTGYGHGTCTLRYGSRDIHEYIMQSLRYLKTYFL